MRHRVFTFFSAFSLALCLAVLALWVRSYWTASVILDDHIRWTKHPGFERMVIGINPRYWGGRGTVLQLDREFVGLTISRGTLTYQSGGGRVIMGEQTGAIQNLKSMNPRDRRAMWHYPAPADNLASRTATGLMSRLGFIFEAAPTPSPITPQLTIAFPLWPVFGAAALVPAVWIWQKRVRQRRSRAGCCAACGYDLRATPERCPECGAAPAATSDARESFRKCNAGSVHAGRI
jgi:hypothetical protein